MSSSSSLSLGEGDELDLFFPVFTVAQFVLLVGWLKVAGKMIDPCVQHSDPTNPRLYDRAAARGLAAAIVARSVAPPPRRPSTLLARALDRERSAPPLSSLAPRCAAGGSRVGYRRERLRGFLALRFDCPLPSSATTRPMPGRRRYGASQATDATFDLHWILRRNMEVSRVVLATAASGTRSCRSSTCRTLG